MAARKPSLSVLQIKDNMKSLINEKIDDLPLEATELSVDFQELLDQHADRALEAARSLEAYYTGKGTAHAARVWSSFEVNRSPNEPQGDFKKVMVQSGRAPFAPMPQLPTKLVISMQRELVTLETVASQIEKSIDGQIRAMDSAETSLTVLLGHFQEVYGKYALVAVESLAQKYIKQADWKKFLVGYYPEEQEAGGSEPAKEVLGVMLSVSQD